MIRQYLPQYLLALVALGLGLAALAGRGPGRRVARGMAWLAAGFLCLNWLAINPPGGLDFSIFRDAGRAVLEGRDPYRDARMLSPPTALPMFAALALVPGAAALPAWTALNLALALLLVPLAGAALAAQGLAGGPRDGGDEGETPWLVAAIVLLSLPIAWGLGLGQVGLVEAVAVFAALLAQGRGRPILAGVALGLASLKPHTMVPALLLFLRHDDWKAWAALVAVVAGLCLASGPPGEFAGRLGEDFRNIAALSAPGGTNDYSFEGPNGHTLIGLDRLAYCLGVRDRGAIRLVLFGGVGLIGLVLAGGIVLGRLGRPAACALTLIYAMLFLYHRMHDAPLLALPLLYAWSAAAGSRGRRRRSFVAASALLVAILMVHPKLVDVAVGRIPPALGPARQLAEGVALPFAVWCLLLAMALILREEWGRPGRPAEAGSRA